MLLCHQSVLQGQNHTFGRTTSRGADQRQSDNTVKSAFFRSRLPAPGFPFQGRLQSTDHAACASTFIFRPIVGSVLSQRSNSLRSISVARPSLRAVSSFSRIAFLMRVWLRPVAFAAAAGA